jgi:hypothetical protein
MKEGWNKGRWRKMKEGWNKGRKLKEGRKGGRNVRLEFSIAQCVALERGKENCWKEGRKEGRIIDRKEGLLKGSKEGRKDLLKGRKDY